MKVKSSLKASASRFSKNELSWTDMLSLTNKAEMICQVDTGESYVAVGRFFNVDVSTIHSIVISKDAHFMNI